MNRLSLPAILLLMLSLTGCFATSLNPLGDGANKVTDSSLVGTWAANCLGFQGKTCKAVVTASSDSDLSINYWDENGKATPLRGSVMAIGAERFLDLSLADIPEKQSNAISLAILAHMAPVHSIWKVNFGEGTLSVRPLNGKALIPFAGHGIQISDPWNSSETPLVTSSSKDLGAFLAAHHNDVFTGDAQVWKRMKAE